MIRTIFVAVTLFLLITAGEGVATGNKDTGPMERAGAALDRGIDKTKDFFSDSAITARVKKKFVEDEYVKARKIKVTTTDRIVTLEGAVASEEIAKRAIGIAVATKGVEKVKNSLKIVTLAPSTSQ